MASAIPFADYNTLLTADLKDFIFSDR